MKYPSGFLFVVIIVLIAVVAAVFGLVSTFSQDMCLHDRLETVEAPDGRYKAVVFRRNCGATTGFSTQISILPIDEELPSESGNAFIADTDHGKAPPERGGGPDVKVVWTAMDQVTVQHHPLARLFSAAGKVGEIRVRYMASADSSQ